MNAPRGSASERVIQRRSYFLRASSCHNRGMIAHTLDREHSILHIRPQSKLEKTDFEELAAVVDPFIAESGGLSGMIIETPGFPGWDSFGAMTAHLRFARDHHRQIKRIAIVTDSKMGNIAEHLVSHFVAAEIRHFPGNDVEAAKQWISSAA